MSRPVPNGRPSAPAVQRNREPILAVLKTVLPETGRVLEIASGAGEHIAYFAERLPRLVWRPSEPDPEFRTAIAHRVAQAGLANLEPPLEIFAEAEDWAAAPADLGDISAVLCINMTQVAPWAAVQGLFAGAARTLPTGGPLVLYGPFMRDGRHTASSNVRFDRALRQWNPDWGVRDTADLDALAAATGFDPAQVVEMPANNLSLIYRRR